ncbi:regulatory protein [Yersinia similis]|uniref:Regulatory protein n=1 Tax=Yersinia similis TaxID=367190 RepID=A0ABN4CPG8_9GAMM|nr:CII family transcriptional regulator [Yersinia similis]AHK20725.1 regulatory protein [Yersinia similis]CFQ60316.1 phage transcriptional regulator [Yersinia similis]
MERATTRNKARIIEGQLLNKIALRGVTDIADAVGVDKSQISRWKENFIPKISMLLAVLEWGVVDDEMARLAKSVALLLVKQKSQQKGRDSEQITINF